MRLKYTDKKVTKTKKAKKLWQQGEVKEDTPIKIDKNVEEDSRIVGVINW